LFFQRITYGHSGTGVYPILRRALLDDAGSVASAHFDFSDLDYSIKHESAMVFFDTVFPFGDTFDPEVRGTRITLIDQYENSRP
jgi:hypothetical protein